MCKHSSSLSRTVWYFLKVVDQPISSALQKWLLAVYGSGHTPARPRVAERLLRENPDFGDLAPYAAGNATGIERNPEATAGMPPLVALTHSSLCRERPADFEQCLRLLLARGEDPNQSWTDPHFPGSALSALYGAAGKNHQPGLTKILLEAGANPNDGESLYHSCETRDLTCMKLLLAAGANPKGTNALNKSLDFDHLACTQLLLDAGADPNEGVPALFWAIRRRRSLAHVEALLRAGADASTAYRDRTPYRWALLFGLREIAYRLQAVTGESHPEGIDKFFAACAAGDRATAFAMAGEHNWIAEVPDALRRMLPDSVEAGNRNAAVLMVELGWPLAAQGGDWNATALNLAVFRGDPWLTRFLLEHGASWEERHGYNDDVRGTLSFASTVEPAVGGDWLACAKALIAAGMPKPGPSYRFSAPIQAYFDSL